MTLKDEITAAETVVHVASGAATEHIQRAATDLGLGATALARYKDFLDGTLGNARSTLVRCREIGSGSPLSAEALAGIVRGLLVNARESIRLMYVTMTILEHRVASAPEGASAPARVAPPSCSFCRRSEAETRLVAGPAAHICGSCTRLACGVLGIALSEAE